MIRKYRLILYGALIAFALLSQALWMKGPWIEPLSFIGLVVVLGGFVEWRNHKKGIK